MIGFSYADFLDFAIACGVRLSLDWDETLLVEYPDGLTFEARKYIEEREKTIADMVKRRAINKAARFMGGPMDGRCTLCESRDWSAFHIGPKRWAVYRRILPWSINDERRIYLGETTSYKKARELAFPAVKP